ncbi:MAG TPA: SGNH/GDSL hydrolase family protein [Acidobacteriota bacterium]|nr:SGNH/GDSL hydrolase family protein [Acidobacteriota bacterium]
MRRVLFQICAIACLLVVTLAMVGDRSRAQQTPALRVLFIGNSLTYVNNLPAVLEAMARESGQVPLVYQTIAFPDFSLEDHWKQGDARKAISTGKWDVVVMQQGPSALPESRVLLLEYVKKFAQETRNSGAKPALYMVWPAKERSFDFDRVSESYRLAAQEVDGLLFPVGDAWRTAWKHDASLPLYSADKFHPSKAGTYLAAAVMYEQLYRRSSVGLPAQLKISDPEVKKIKLPRKQAEALQMAATETNQGQTPTGS